MKLRNIIVGINASGGEAFGVTPDVIPHIFGEDVALVEDEVTTISSDIITLLHQHFGESLEFIAINIDGVRYGLSSRAVIDGTFIDDMALKIPNFLLREIAKEKEQYGSEG